MQVIIDGVSYVPWRDVPQEPSKFKLTTDHIDTAKSWPDWWDCLKWAIEAEASPMEMTLWRSARLKEVQPVATESRAKVAPLPTSKKSRPALF